MAATPDNPPVGAGTLLGGRYRLEHRIASGGMASVWEAHDEVLDRKVAVKLLHPHLAADEQFVARFRREAVAAARLAHHNIVAIYDTCSELGHEAIVMELVRGSTLRAELDRRGRFDPHSAARVVAEIADALAAAHAAGIVHRDVKPANVLLSGDGRVLVADFGIAKAGDGLDLTGTGTTLGTAKYLAPEQVDPAVGPVDGRADVYAAGVILHELLSGSPPFVADTEAGTAITRLHREPPPLEGVDPTLASIVRQAMARDPAQRFASAAELRDALRDFARGATTQAVPLTDVTTVVVGDSTRVAPAPAPVPPAPAPKQQAKKRRVGPYVMGTIVVAAVAVAVGLWLGTGDGDPPAEGSTTPPASAGGGLAVARVAAFDPQGDGGENDDEAGRVADGDSSSAWRTECYTTAAFGNLKDGVGLVVELTEASGLEELRVDSPVTGWSAEVYVAPEPGDELGAWGAPVASATASGPTTSFALDGAEGRFLLLWFTGLAQPPDCSGRPFGVSVSELSVV